MTAICWDGETLAADNMSTSGFVKSRSQKVHVVEHHSLGKCLFAMSGNVKASARVVDVLTGAFCNPKGVAVLDLDPAFTYGILVDSNKRVYDVYGDGHYGPAANVLDKFTTNGSAWEFLLGALVAGACAERAVGLAEEYRTDTGFGCSKLVWSEVFGDANERPDDDIPY